MELLPVVMLDASSPLPLFFGTLLFELNFYVIFELQELHYLKDFFIYSRTPFFLLSVGVGEVGGFIIDRYGW